MSRIVRRRAFGAAVMLAMAATACGVPQSEPGGDTVAVGEIGDPAHSDRIVNISAFDDLTYLPPQIEVETNEVVTFVVTNEGNARHEFILGDEQMQIEHESEMSSQQVMAHDHPYGVSLDPRETKQMTWRFTEPGSFFFGCHEPGHYDGGMVGTIDVG